jgi:hypothetical protein
MAGRVIQGFFIGGAMRPQPAPRVAAGEARPRHPTGAPPPAFAGWVSPLQARMASGRPPLAHQGAGHVVQPRGGNDSFEIDPVQLGLACGGGKPLPPALLAKMESALGADFSAVRVHVGPQAPRIGAIAFTTGNDLYFAPGQFQPDTISGQQLIGHELAHVVQQRQGRVHAPGSGMTVVQDRALEAEADRLGMRAAAHPAPLQAKPAGPSLVGRPGSRTAQRSAPSSSSPSSLPLPATLSVAPRSPAAKALEPTSGSMSAVALERTGIPELYWRFIHRGGTVYRRTDTDPLTVFRDGWTRNGYKDLVCHTDTEQGLGSNWVATTENLTGMDEGYGTYAFEIEIEWHQGVLVNPAYETLTNHRNPHADQNEVAVWRQILGNQITAVWVPIGPGQQAVERADRTPWANSYVRYSPAAYRDARRAGLVNHPPF